MSTDWYVHCLDCKQTHSFTESNHLDRTMAALCEHAAAIAALQPLFKMGFDIELNIPGTYTVIDVDWFAEHAGHRLVPINEYGALLDQCVEYVRCSCGNARRCERERGHDGEHDPTARRKGLS